MTNNSGGGGIESIEFAGPWVAVELFPLAVVQVVCEFWESREIIEVLEELRLEIVNW